MYDGSSSSPLSPESVQISASAFVPDKNFRDGSGAPHGRYPADDYTIPPVRLRAERSYSHKREYAMRDESSDEDETVRRRQADDITPKQKKRQPKVAEAYRSVEPKFHEYLSNRNTAAAGKVFPRVAYPGVSFYLSIISYRSLHHIVRSSGFRSC